MVCFVIFCCTLLLGKYQIYRSPKAVGKVVQMKKKLCARTLAFLLSFCLLFSACPSFVFATGASTEVQTETETETPVETPQIETGGDDVGEIVYSADELEAAIDAQYSVICIGADFQLDRTFYVTNNLKLYAREKRTLTRAAEFASDIFVVGADKDGVLTEEEITFTLGSFSEEADLFTIDGNKDNTTVDVVGSALFLSKQAIVNIYADVSIVNNKKVGNERTFEENYVVSYPVKVGGAVAVICEKAEMNIHGGRQHGQPVCQWRAQRNRGYGLSHDRQAR